MSSGKFVSSSHINQFSDSSLIDHDVLRLYVSVDDVVLVEILDGEESAGNIVLSIEGAQKPDVSDNIKELGSRDILEQEKNVEVILE